MESYSKTEQILGESVSSPAETSQTNSTSSSKNTKPQIKKADSSQFGLFDAPAETETAELFQEEENDEEDDTETKLVYRSEDGKKNTTKNEDSEAIDPRWNALKDLKNKLK